MEGDIVAGLDGIEEVFDCLFVGEMADEAKVSWMLETEALSLCLLEEGHFGLLLAPALNWAWHCCLCLALPSDHNNAPA